MNTRRPLPWLLDQKIAVPARVDGNLGRAELVERAMPTRRRLTVLQAPGGFGKTTLLVECCHRLRADGVPAAWVSVDEQDEPDVLDTYIAYACQSAVAGVAAGSEPPTPDTGAPRAGSGSRTALAAREISDLSGPFVLVFDELDRLGNAESSALLEFLLERGPPNLHLAFACRELPAGLNVAGAVLEGRALILSAEDLRFSPAEVADFFGGRLSKERLASLMSESSGWPFALRISRNEMESGRRGDPRAAQAFVENWVESRLFDGLGSEDREFLLDVGLFEWMDAALLDDALERSDSMHRIDTMPVLVGMLEPVADGGTEVWRLHPLIREHCVRRRFRDTPERFRAVHMRIADSLARRGHTVAAMRHALEAGQPGLAGELLERAGGVRLCLRDGPVQTQAANRLLSANVVASRPPLALVRCLSSVLSGRMEEAKKSYHAIAGAFDAIADDTDENGVQLAADICLVRGMIALYGSERMDSDLVRTQLADVARLVQSERIDAMTRGHLEYALCLAANMTGSLEAAHVHAAHARQCFAQSPYMTVFVDLQQGQAAMAAGRVRDAAAHYRHAQRLARKNYVPDAVPAAVCEVLRQELAMECGHVAPGAAPSHVPTALQRISPTQSYAAASGVVVECRLRDQGVDSALAGAEEMLGYVRSARLPALERYVSALKVSLLAGAGRFGEGLDAWQSAGLPGTAVDCLDLAGQTWREMEALSCAQLRLAIARARFDEGRDFAEHLRTLAAARGLRRTLMRALALSIVLEARRGATAAAAGHLREYLGLYAETPYAGPLVRERDDCATVVTALLDAGADDAAEDAARSVLAAMDRADAGGWAVLTERETDVLQRLGKRHSDKQIAADLGISTFGVRHHIRKLFDKLDVRRRGEAVRRAQEMGLIEGEF